MKKLSLTLVYLLGLASQVTATEKETALIKSFGEEFTIKEGQTAVFKGSKLSLKVTGFSEGVCAIPGFNCGIGWKPPVVRYDLILDGKKLDPDLSKPIKRAKEVIFDVFIKQSDYKSYAVVSVTPLFEACKIRGTYCWTDLAWKTKDAGYCEMVTDVGVRKSCQDYIHNIFGD